VVGKNQRSLPALRQWPWPYDPGAMNGSLLCPFSQSFAKMVRQKRPMMLGRCVLDFLRVINMTTADATAAAAAALSWVRLDWIVTKPLPPRPLFRGHRCSARRLHRAVAAFVCAPASDYPLEGARYLADRINAGPGQRYDVIWQARRPGNGSSTVISRQRLGAGRRRSNDDYRRARLASWPDSNLRIHLSR
jgi:hypothetical protein